MQKIVVPETRRHQYMTFADPRAGFLWCKSLKMRHTCIPCRKPFSKLISAMGEMDIKSEFIWKISQWLVLEDLKKQ